MEIRKNMATSEVVGLFMDDLRKAFPGNYSLTKTEKVNMQCFRKEAFTGVSRIVSRDGKERRATLLQVWCWTNNINITEHGLVRSDKVSGLIEGIAEGLAHFFPDMKWEADKKVSVRKERIALEDLFA